MHLLALGIRTFEMLGSITHRAAVGFCEPERRVIRRSIQMVTQMSETTLLQINRMDRSYKAFGHLESNQLIAAAREATMVGHGAIGRGCVLTHTTPPRRPVAVCQGSSGGGKPAGSPASHAVWGSALD